MSKPAARVGDMHICPMITGLVPHVGGPILPPGVPTVFIGGMPAATATSMCTCTGPPDTITVGSTGVFISGKPAARMGDMCAHGGMVVLGCFTVFIGETGGGGGGGAGGAGGGANLNKMGAGQAAGLKNAAALKDAADKGDENAKKTGKEDFKAQFTLVDEAEKGISGVKYEIETNDGKKFTGKTDGSGKTQNVSGYTAADCRVAYFDKN